MEPTGILRLTVTRLWFCFALSSDSAGMSAGFRDECCAHSPSPLHCPQLLMQCLLCSPHWEASLNSKSASPKVMPHLHGPQLLTPGALGMTLKGWHFGSPCRTSSGLTSMVLQTGPSLLTPPWLFPPDFQISPQLFQRNPCEDHLPLPQISPPPGCSGLGGRPIPEHLPIEIAQPEIREGTAPWITWSEGGSPKLSCSYQIG